MEFQEELKTTHPHLAISTVFDVGANMGQSTTRFLTDFPEAHIHAFEPASSIFNVLHGKHSEDPRVSLHKIALDVSEGVVKFTNKPAVAGNHISWVPAKETYADVEDVPMSSGDQFCKLNAINSIEFLKIDTEGNDLRVLTGFTSLLRERKITFIQVECATNLDNRFHVHLERFIHFLHPFGYRLYNLYEPHRTVYRTGQILKGMWFCNAVFVLEVARPRLRKDGNN